jgi:putative transcriptional regulator
MSTERQDWTLADAMTDAEIHAAALSDPDAQPLTEAQFARGRRGPHIRFVRLAVHLSREAFAERVHIPVETQRAWEEHRAEPSAAERAYMCVIMRAPETVLKALGRPIAVAAG